MEIVILPTAADVARAAADIVGETVSADRAAVIGVATGSSPQGIYAELARRVAARDLSFAEATAFALDEYVGIPRAHPESYASVIDRDVTVPLGFDPQRVHVPDGRASDLAAAAAAYDRAIRDAGGVDVQIVGIGANGHIGFNEPTSSLASRTRLKTLAPQTRADNARFFEHADQVPTHCLTQGIGTILEARRIVLVAQGEVKAAALAAAVEGPVSARVPASALQLHASVTVLVDEPAASRFALADYYRHVEENLAVVAGR